MIKIQNAWLKLYIDNNIDLRKKAKNDIWNISSYYKVFHSKFIRNRNEKKTPQKTKILMNKPVFSGLSILKQSKILK